MLTITAIVTTFNRAEMLRECLDSLLSQTRPPDQIVVIDDGSNDHTAAVLEAYADRVIGIHQPNSGKAAALNNALKHASGEAIWICDDDDLAAPGALLALASALETSPDVDFVYGAFKRFEDGPEGRRFMPPSFEVRVEEPDTMLRFLEEMFTFQYAMLVRRRLYDRVGEFNINLVRSQDYDMALRLARIGTSKEIPDIIFYQRQHAGARGSEADRISELNMRRKWLEYDKHIFRKIRDDYPLYIFTPTFAREWPSEAAERAAHVQRAAVLANRAIWDAALNSLSSACSLGAAQTPSPPECHLARVVVRSDLAWDRLLNQPELLSRLRGLAKRNAYGRRLIACFVRPLRWQARNQLMKGEWAGAIQRLRLLLSIYIIAAVGR